MTKSIKDKNSELMNQLLMFLSISLLEDYDPNNNNNNKDDHHNTTLKPKLKKKDRIHLSKKNGKLVKKEKKLKKKYKRLNKPSLLNNEKISSSSIKNGINFISRNIKSRVV